MYIILTDADVSKVRGISPSVSFSAIDPQPLKDGTYIVSDSVLSDPANVDVSDYLKSLPTIKEMPVDQVFDDTKQVDINVYTSKNIPPLKTVGLRKDK